MNAWLVAPAILGLCAAIVAAVGGAAFPKFRRRWHVRSPRDGVEARVPVDALGGARSELIGARRPSVARCSHRAPWKGCDEGPPLPVVGTPAVLVPLDGTRGSEAALPAALRLARLHGGRVRLLRVLPVATVVRDVDDHVVMYADRKAAGDEHAARGYLRGLRSRLADVPVEEVVRFGEAATEILREAEAPDVAWITMATRPARGLTRWLGRSVTRTVGRAAWVPVTSTPPLSATRECGGASGVDRT